MQTYMKLIDTELSRTYCPEYYPEGVAVQDAEVLTENQVCQVSVVSSVVTTLPSREQIAEVLLIMLNNCKKTFDEALDVARTLWQAGVRIDATSVLTMEDIVSAIAQYSGHSLPAVAQYSSLCYYVPAEVTYGSKVRLNGR